MCVSGTAGASSRATQILNHNHMPTKTRAWHPRTRVKPMSRCNTSQPEQHGVTHQGQAPQVAVRDGNRLLCPCCGQTIMVLKEKRFTPPKRHHTQGDPRRTWPSLERLIAEQEAHYQNGSAEEVPKEEPRSADNDQEGPAYRADSLVMPIDPKIAAHEFPDFDPSSIPKPVKLPSERLPEAKLHSPPTRSENGPYDQRRRSACPFEEATTYEMARLYAWAYYRLQRLAVQIEQEIAAKQSEIDRLKTKRSGGQVEPSKTESGNNTDVTIQTRAQADLGVAPRVVRTRGIVVSHGTQRHAHEDEGMAPASVSIEPVTSTSTAHQRGPP